MRRMTNGIFSVLFSLATAGWILTAASQPLWADVTGTILGNVTDPTGAAVPGAYITLQNSLTGLIRHTVSDSTGGCEFLTVPIGTGYSVTAEAPATVSGPVTDKDIVTSSCVSGSRCK